MSPKIKGSTGERQSGSEEMEQLLFIGREGIKRVSFLGNQIVALGECLYIDEDEICPEELIDFSIYEDAGVMALLGHENLYIYSINKSLMTKYSLDLDFMLLNASRVSLGPSGMVLCGTDDEGPLALLVDYRTGNIRYEFNANCVDALVKSGEVHMINVDVPEDFTMDYVAKLDIYDLRKRTLETVYYEVSEELTEGRLRAGWGEELFCFNGVTRMSDRMKFPGLFGLPLPSGFIITFKMDSMNVFNREGMLIMTEDVGWIMDADWRSNLLLLGGPEGIKLYKLSVEELEARSVERLEERRKA